MYTFILQWWIHISRPADSYSPTINIDFPKKDFIKNFMSWWNVDIFIFTKNKNKFKIRIFTNDTEWHDRSRRLAFITWICSINDIFPTEQSIVYSCVSRYLEKLIKNKIILSAPVCTIVACIFVSDLCRIYL